jgi:uroporphyrinogen-III synthase
MSARLWITRTQPGADRQAAELEAAGYRTLVAPVLAVEATGAPLPAGNFDVVVFLSEHAVNFTEDFSFCAGAQLFAIGPQTGAILEAAGYSARVPEDPRSEGLLATPEFAVLTGQRVLLVAGEGGRDLLAETLARRGAAVHDYRCYRRVAAADVELNADQVDVIVAASGDGLAAIAACWFGRGADPDIPLLVPSARVAGLAVRHGFTRVIECSGAGSRAILSALQRLSVN